MHFQQTLAVDWPAMKNNQLELWQHILGRSINIGEKFCSPFRNDTNPGCTLDVVGEYIRLRDFADPIRHQKHIFELVQLERNCSFEEALYYLSSKVKLTPTKSESSIIKKYKEQFIIKSFPFTNQAGKIYYPEAHQLFWMQYGIVPQQLLQDYVFPTKAYKAGKNKLSHIIIPNDVTFTYYFKASRHNKIYRPTKTGMDKWITNCDPQDIWFWKDIDYSQHYLIITKSYKDARILKNLGYNVIAVQSESTYLPDNYTKYLASKFDKIFVLFDNDEEGIGWVMKHQEKYNSTTNSLKFIPVWYDINLPKDTGEIYVEKGKQAIITELKHMI